MNCERWQLLIEEYVDGELDAPDRRRVEGHVSGCPTCRQTLQQMTREVALYGRYQRGLEMPSNLWSRVQARIRNESSQTSTLVGRFQSWLRSAFQVPRISFASTAALMLLAVGITVAVMVFVESGSRGVQRDIALPGTKESVVSRPVTPAEKTVETNALAATTSQPSRDLTWSKRKPRTMRTDPALLVQQAEKNYQEAIAVLSKEIERRGSRLDPALKDHFEEAIAAIDRNIAETRRAVRGNPQDPVAAQYLLTAYARKLDVLKELASL